MGTRGRGSRRCTKTLRSVTISRASLQRIRARPLFAVVLAPRPDAVVRRAGARTKPSGYGSWTVEALDLMLRQTPRIGLWLDTSEQTGPETVEEILRRAEDARVR